VAKASLLAGEQLGIAPEESHLNSSASDQSVFVALIFVAVGFALYV
jgi:hypothetical protein